MKPHCIFLYSATIYSVIIGNKWPSFQKLTSEECVLNLVFCFNYFDDGQSADRWVGARLSVVLIKPLDTDRVLRIWRLRNLNVESIILIINDSHMEELKLYWIQYKNSLKYKVDCFRRFSCLHSQLSYFNSIIVQMSEKRDSSNR